MNCAIRNGVRCMTDGVTDVATEVVADVVSEPFSLARTGQIVRNVDCFRPR